MVNLDSSCVTHDGITHEVSSASGWETISASNSLWIYDIHAGSTDSRFLEHSVTPEAAARMVRSYQKELSDLDKAKLKFINIQPTKAGVATLASTVHSRELRPKVLTALPAQVLTRTFGRPHGRG
jgi:hypothetical protein